LLCDNRDLPKSKIMKKMGLHIKYFSPRPFQSVKISKPLILLLFTFSMTCCNAQESLDRRNNRVFIESQGVLPGSWVLGYERYVHFGKWVRYGLRGGLGASGGGKFAAMIGNSLIVGRKLNFEFGVNYIDNFFQYGLFAPGNYHDSGLQPIIGIRIQNLKIPMNFRMFYEIPSGGINYIAGGGVSVGYVF